MVSSRLQCSSMNDDDLYDVDGDARDCEDDGDGDVWCAEEFGVCQSLCPVTECDGAVGEVGNGKTSPTHSLYPQHVTRRQCRKYS